MSLFRLGFSVMAMMAALMSTPLHADDSNHQLILDGIVFDLDWQVTDTRAICAEGNSAQIDARVAAEHGIRSDELPPIHRTCLNALYESDRRGLRARLYAEYHPDNPTDYLNRILEASAQGRSEYETPAGVTKNLPCELAFDAGFTAARQSPDQALAANLSAAQVDAITSDCFEPSTVTSTLHGLLAGAHHARRPEPPRTHFLDQFDQ